MCRNMLHTLLFVSTAHIHTQLHTRSGRESVKSMASNIIRLGNQQISSGFFSPFQAIKFHMILTNCIFFPQILGGYENGKALP